MPSKKSPSTSTRVHSESEGKNPFEEDEDEEAVSKNPFENSEEFDETNPFYEASPSPEKSTNPFEVSDEFKHEDSITPTADLLQSPADSEQRDRSPGRFKKKIHSPSPSDKKSSRFEKKKSPVTSSRAMNRSPRLSRKSSPPPPPSSDSPEVPKATSARGSARGTAHPALTKEQDARSKDIAKTVLTPG